MFYVKVSLKYWFVLYYYGFIYFLILKSVIQVHLEGSVIKYICTELGSIVITKVFTSRCGVSKMGCPKNSILKWEQIFVWKSTNIRVPTIL